MLKVLIGCVRPRICFMSGYEANETKKLFAETHVKPINIVVLLFTWVNAADSTSLQLEDTI
jgi:hypothetical protein